MEFFLELLPFISYTLTIFTGNSLKPLSVLESSRDNNLISIKYKKVWLLS